MKISWEYSVQLESASSTFKRLSEATKCETQVPEASCIADDEMGNP